jgi:protein-disulfide isomerase-like protein with CxxC motif
MASPIHVTHFGDPACPWGYSANPALCVLRWRYGDGLRWRHVMIGLTERAEQYVARGYTALGMALGHRRFRRLGMPFSGHVRPRPTGTARACRAVVATRLAQPEHELRAFRALQHGYFTTGDLMDEEPAIARALGRVEGLDVARVVDLLDAPEVSEAYERDRAEARTAAGGATEAQGKAANTDGAVRFTAPSLVLEADGRRLEAGGFQPVEAYDVCIANLDPTLERRGPAQDAHELLAAFDHGLTTREAAACMTARNEQPDDERAAAALLELVVDGRATRTPLGDDALWEAA